MKKDFLNEFNRVSQSIGQGTTHVFSELRTARKVLFELLPLLLIQSILLVVSTMIIQAMQIDELFSMVILLVVNAASQGLSSAVLVCLKRALRVRKLKKYGLEVNEKNLTVLVCMEYQFI